jgi:hypothetical protein
MPADHPFVDDAEFTPAHRRLVNGAWCATKDGVHAAMAYITPTLLRPAMLAIRAGCTRVC